jgi:two-component system cell cycle response regulator CpdR
MDGHVTVTAEDGAEALEILTREQGAFDLLLTDIQMPVMDGIALALAVARDFDDRLCRSARTRLRAQCHRA